jgi:hypothetical protein
LGRFGGQITNTNFKMQKTIEYTRKLMPFKNNFSVLSATASQSILQNVTDETKGVTDKDQALLSSSCWKFLSSHTTYCCKAGTSRGKFTRKDAPYQNKKIVIAPFHLAGGPGYVLIRSFSYLTNSAAAAAMVYACRNSMAGYPLCQPTVLPSQRQPTAPLSQRSLAVLLPLTPARCAASACQPAVSRAAHHAAPTCQAAPPPNARLQPLLLHRRPHTDALPSCACWCACSVRV